MISVNPKKMKVRNEQGVFEDLMVMGGSSDGSGGGDSYFEQHTLTEDVAEYHIPFPVTECSRFVIGINQFDNANIVSTRVYLTASTSKQSACATDSGTSPITLYVFDKVNLYFYKADNFYLTGFVKRSNNVNYIGSIMNYNSLNQNYPADDICITGETLEAGTVISIRAWK